MPFNTVDDLIESLTPNKIRRASRIWIAAIIMCILFMVLILSLTRVS